jgi:hypothetical protein
MVPISRFANGNLLLQALSPDDRALLAGSLDPIDLPLRRDMEKPNKRIENVFFMETGIASVVAIQPNGAAVEIGIVGCEGMSHRHCAWYRPVAAFDVYSDQGKRTELAASTLRKAMDESPSLQKVLLNFAQAFAIQTAHTAIANARAKLHERLARWILMAHDRVGGNCLSLTHEFLSLMLAVRRAGVTEAIHVLEKQSLIESHRAEITILNRKGIEKIAGNFYGVPEAEYRRLLML